MRVTWNMYDSMTGLIPVRTVQGQVPNPGAARLSIPTIALARGSEVRIAIRLDDGPEEEFTKPIRGVR